MDANFTTDLLVIGGGINGTGIAADAAGRGLKVILCEACDLASATSSWSTKLIHGGLRYLEQYQFRLVREALKEREILIHKAPFLIHPLEFILPHAQHLRPKWMIRAGLFLYDHLAKRKVIPGSHQINLTKSIYANALKPEYQFGFSYYDCQTDDARLVILNALAAQEQGATILTRSKCQNAERFDDHWIVTLQDKNNNVLKIITKVIINAAGPWANEVLDHVIHIKTSNQIRLIKGSHIVVPQLYPGKHAYILQHTDNRVVFSIPFQQKFTLIGTTDVQYQGDPRAAKISDNEVNYLLNIINHYFKNPLSNSDILWSYAGVRPLLTSNSGENPSAISREYHLELDQLKAPVLSVFGGKLTAFRSLSENAVNLLRPFFPNMKPAWTAQSYLPGGDLAGYSLKEYWHYCERLYPWLTTNVLHRYITSYGSRTEKLLKDTKCLTDLGPHFGCGLYAKEVDFLLQTEWAQTIEDILWRRSKLGLLLSSTEKESILKTVKF